jgi:hypothetical protein
MARDPDSAHFLATPRKRLILRPSSATSAPSAANVSAMLRPTPLLAPVTTATLLRNRLFGLRGINNWVYFSSVGGETPHVPGPTNNFLVRQSIRNRVRLFSCGSMPAFLARSLGAPPTGERPNGDLPLILGQRRAAIDSAMHHSI